MLINLNEVFDASENSAETDSSDYISITEKPLNLFKNQVILEQASKKSTSFKMVFKKIRNFIKVGHESDLLESMKGFLPERGLEAVYCPNQELFLRFQENYIRK